ncbi:ParA family protein [Candidatus Saccharibacteria bacterium]|nr:ParA family protein [Candidatus Saccharibacteria bacterium]
MAHPQPEKSGPKKPRRSRLQDAPTARQQTTGPRPQYGVHGVIWKLGGAWLYSRFGWKWLIRLSLRDRFENAMESLWDLRKTQMVIATVNSKGGSGKTTATVWLSAFLAFVLKRQIVAFDVNESPGHTAKRLGVDREETIQLREFLSRRNSLRHYDSFAKVVASHRQTGVSVIASEEASIESLHQEDFEEALYIAKRNAHSVFCDCGNVIDGPTNYGAVKKADVVVFTGIAGFDDSLDDISNTMKRYTDLGYAEKVKSGIVVIFGAYNRNRGEFAARYGLPIGRVFVVPFNKYMARNNPVLLDMIPRQVQVVLLEILVAIAKAAQAPET